MQPDKRSDGSQSPLCRCKAPLQHTEVQAQHYKKGRASLVAALQSAKSLRKMLCLSYGAEPAPRYAGAGLCNSIGALATITSLVRLHLSVLNQDQDWQPLAQLSCLQHLALRCPVFLCSVCLGHCSKVSHALASCAHGYKRHVCYLASCVVQDT